MINTPLVLALGGSIGAVAASFCSTAVLRASTGEQWLLGPSRCDRCAVELKPWQTAPLLSFVVLRGACSRCRGRISHLHPLSEAAGLIIVTSAMFAASPMRAFPLVALGFLLLLSSLVDVRSQRLPDVLNLAIAAVCGGLAFARSPFEGLVGVACAVAAMTMFLLIRWSFARRRGRQGLGLGDVKLIGALALWLGVTTPWVIALSCLIGLVAFAVLKPADGRLSFGPAIAVSAWGVGICSEAGLWPT